MSLFGNAPSSSSSKPALKIKKRLVSSSNTPENSQAARKRLEEEAARKRLEERREKELAELAERDRLRRMAKADAAKRHQREDHERTRSEAGPLSPSKPKARKRLTEDDYQDSRSPSKKGRSAAGTPVATPSRSRRASYSDDSDDAENGSDKRRKKRIDVQQPISSLEGREYFDLEAMKGSVAPPAWQGKIDSESIVLRNLKAYVACELGELMVVTVELGSFVHFLDFPQEDFSIERHPSVKLAYPGKDCFESLAESLSDALVDRPAEVVALQLFAPKAEAYE